MIVIHQNDLLSEIQRLRMLASLLELINSILEDQLPTKEVIAEELLGTIHEMGLHEPLHYYEKEEN